MSLNLSTRLAHAWNAFTSRDPTQYIITGPGYSSRPDRPRLSRGNEKSIATSIFNRIALDVSSVNIKHCRLDKNGRYVEDIDSGLNNCLNLEANKDQTGRAFIQDVVLSMLDEGCVALVPVETTIDPKSSNSYQIDSMRTGKITEWYPDMVRVRLYNDRTGEKEEILLPKNQVAIIENPLYAVVNEYNSTMQRLIRKLSLLDVTDEQTASGKLDLIIQLPYVIKTEARRAQVERRRKDIIDQLTGSQYGIAYTDGTEKIIQLNRSLENNLLKQVEYLTNMVYSQLGITQSVLDGTADEKTMLNYMNRTVEPIISAIVDELKRKFLTKTARSQLQSIVYFIDPFRLVPANDIAEIADKFKRNEIMTSNEIRQIVGMQPSKDPKADKLVNSNISQAKQDMSQTSSATEAYEEGGYSQNG
ncbi:phage portal protein [Blautia massiliensis (ex Durand et al. 2017)]|uniref:phage portal protein n=1 Tax=Blautia massiliensis (ex Durand et al. 2017) TaxID=1737424 RepID=UPI0022E5997A|nr:phage portal protein [Blautia massiliensis (ex Durand et al. 2017)]